MPSTAYFPEATPQCPTFEDDSEWHPLIDGERYFAELDVALRDLGPGDSVQISGLQLWPGLDLAGRAPGTAGYEPLGGRLIAVAAAGAQVRVLLAGQLLSRSWPLPGLAEFRSNVTTARSLAVASAKDDDDAGPPLAGCLLVDWSGTTTGSNHRKVVVVDRGGEVTAFVAGIDLVDERFDAAPHDRLRLKGRRWGWHDAAVRLRGPAAVQVHRELVIRWREAATLPPRYVAPGRLMNPRVTAPPLAPPPAQAPIDSPGTSVRVLRSVSAHKVSSVLPWRRRTWDTLPAEGLHEIFETFTTAIAAARSYLYLEDQYLAEYLGGQRHYELYPHLRAAARRGVKVVLVGSGVRDPEDPGIYLRPINRSLNRDLRRKLVKPLADGALDCVTVWRVQDCTVHSKVLLVDDTFACIGSANMFSRSMHGDDSEVSAAVSTTTTLVRDLRVQLWGEHLRIPVDGDVRADLENVDIALGLWSPRWLPGSVAPDIWSARAHTSALRPVWPKRA